MRYLLLATILLGIPASVATAAPHCAVAPRLQGASTLAIADARANPSVTLPAPVTPQAAATRVTPPLPAVPIAAATRRAIADQASPLPPAPSATGSAAPKPLPAATIAAVPALKRIASAGATLLDLGTAHGMRTVFAKKDNAFQVFYVVPDGSAAIGGIMWDASGRDVTRDQVAPIPGVMPTVRIGPNAGPAAVAPAVDHPAGDPLTLVHQTTYGTVGAPHAPRLWMFVDPFCSFSITAMKQLQPYVQAGRLRLSVIPVSVLDYEDQGRSTPAAKVMVSRPESEMVADWEGDRLTGAASDAATSLLARNMAVAGALHLRGTPTLIWKAADGSAGRSDGIPPDVGAMIASIGR